MPCVVAGVEVIAAGCEGEASNARECAGVEKAFPQRFRLVRTAKSLKRTGFGPDVGLPEPHPVVRLPGQALPKLCTHSAQTEAGGRFVFCHPAAYIRELRTAVYRQVAKHTSGRKPTF